LNDPFAFERISFALQNMLDKSKTLLPVFFLTVQISQWDIPFCAMT
jgi:hypothetical protein